MAKLQNQLDGSIATTKPLSAAEDWGDHLRGRARAMSEDAVARVVLLLPGILIVLLLSVFPLIISLYLSASRVDFVKGGIQVVFVGLENYVTLFTGIDKAHLLGSW